MKVLLDVTRLLRRSGQLTPTGIDRVELAYAYHLLNAFPGESSFVGRFRSRVWQLNPAMVRHFLDTIRARWDLSNALITRKELLRLERFLNLRAGAMAAAPGPMVPRSALRSILPSLQTIVSPFNLMPSIFQRPIEKGAVYLNVSHEGLNAPEGIDKLVSAHDLKSIYLIHDLIPLSHPEYVRPGDEEKHEARMLTVLHSATATIYNSPHTKQMLESFASTHALEAPPGIVSLLGVEDKFRSPEATADQGHPYFVMVGTIEPRKNHLLVLHVWRHLVEKMGKDAPKLIIVGRRGWENENVIDIIERCRGLDGHLLECNRLPDAQLKRLLSGARAVLFPSFAEGYGLPLAEALALKVPVICSNLEVFRDIAGDVPEYLDPIDGMSWLNVVADFARPASSRRAAQMAKMGRFTVPTWKQHFAAVDELIAEVAKPRRSLRAHLVSSIQRKIALSSASEQGRGADEAALAGVSLPHSSTI